MKKIILFAALLGFCGLTTLQAQDIPDRKNDGVNQKNNKYNRDNNMRNLNLSEKQKQELKNIREEGRVKMEAIKNNNALTAQQKKEQIQDLQNAQKDKMSTVLTKEQLNKMEANRKDGDFKRGDRNRNTNDPYDNKEQKMKRGGRAGHSNADNWKTELNLTDSQERKLAALREENRLKIEEIKNNPRLSDEKKEHAIRSFMSRQKNKRDAILSPAQQRIWDAHYSGMREGLDNQKRNDIERINKENQYYYN